LAGVGIGEHTLRPAVAPTTHMFVQPFSFFERALAPDNMLIISFMDAGLSKVLNILLFFLPPRPPNVTRG
jgi:hypothetical protein